MSITEPTNQASQSAPKSATPAHTRIAHTGNDSYIARVVNTGSPKRPVRRSHRLTGTGGVPLRIRVFKWSSRVLSVLLALILTFTLSAPAAMASDGDNWFTRAVKDTFCTGDSWMNAAGAPSLGTLIGTDSGDADFYDTPRTAKEILGQPSWTVYRGESGKAIGNNGQDRVAAGDEDDDKRVKGLQGDCVPIVPIITTYMGNTMLGISYFLTDTSGWVMEQAYDPKVLDDLNGMSSLIITGVNENGAKVGPGLKDNLYLEFLNVVIFLGALWLFFQGVVKRRTTTAVGGFAWMFGAAIGFTLIIFNPTLLPSMASSVMDNVGDAALTTTAGNASKLGSNGDVDVCAIPGKNADAITRKLSCNMYMAGIVAPWSVGQFGENSYDLNGKAPGVINVGDGEKVNNLALWQLRATSLDMADMNRGDAVTDARLIMWYQTVDAVASPEATVPNSYNDWSGANSSSRLAMATMALVVASCLAIVVFVLAGTLLVAKVVVVLIVLLSPLFLLLGIHPGFGRRIAGRWFEMLASAFLKQMLAVVMLSVLLAMYAVILPRASDQWGASILATIAITVAALVYRKEFFKVFTGSINLGGGGILSDAPAERAGEMFKGTATGATVGLGMGAIAGGKVAGGIMKSGVGSKGARVAAASRAVATGATKGAVRTGFRGGMAGGSRAGAALAMSGSMGQNVGGQAAQGVASKFNEKHGAGQPGTSDSAQPQGNDSLVASRSQGDRFTKNHSAYMKDWSRHKNTPAWQDHIKRSYGLSHVPNPYEEAFDGYKKDRTSWTEDDVPRPLHSTGESRDADTSSGSGSSSSSAPVDVPRGTPVPATQPAVLNGKPVSVSSPQRASQSAPQPERSASRGTPAQRPVNNAPAPERASAPSAPSAGAQSGSEGKQKSTKAGKMPKRPDPPLAGPQLPQKSQATNEKPRPRGSDIPRPGGK